MAEITYGEYGKEDNNPESALKDVKTGLKELGEHIGEHNRKYKKVMLELLKKVPSNKSPSYWSKIFEWCTKVRQTLTTDNILKGLNAVGKKIYNGILKAVDYLVKLCKRERSVEEATTHFSPNKTRDSKGYLLNAEGGARRSGLSNQGEEEVLLWGPRAKQTSPVTGSPSHLVAQGGGNLYNESGREGAASQGQGTHTQKVLKERQGTQLPKVNATGQEAGYRRRQTRKTKGLPRGYGKSPGGRG